ncbi:MAG: ABC transporter ATP-binding protein [Chloroflexi bacterium]|nr:MAG: ABC transporter ATP-binding protein [Chloroflexota bacterium]
MIRIEHLTYTYPDGSQPALQDVSLQIAAGEFVLVAGPSGSGKSTLLRCLNGLVPHFSGGQISGHVLVGGKDVIALGPTVLSRYVGFVFQSPEAQAVLDEVEAEIAFGLENVGMSPEKMRKRVAEVLALLNLEGVRKRPLSTLSGGERQRVAIGSAIALRPRLLVLDEPTSQLDPEAARQVMQAVSRLNRQVGLTVVLATHRLEGMLPYADRLIWLEKGRIIHNGAVPDVITKLPEAPPVIRLAQKKGWYPLPLSVAEARQFIIEEGRRLRAKFVQPVTEKLPPHETCLLVQNLSFGWNGRPVLRDVNLVVRPGEAVALMGHNGVGKTTLLRCVVGLLSPQSGEVWVNGRSVNGRSVAEICRDVGYLPQNPDDLLFAETVREEIAVTLRNHGVHGTIETIDNLLAELGLSELADAYPRDLSVGQRQRVALGTVVVTRPGLLLLDEPTRGLDTEARRRLIAIWQKWLAEGMGLLIVTHDVELVARLAHRVVILADGQVAATGKTAEILPHFPQFAPQITRLFPGQHWLTVADALTSQTDKEV